MTFETDFDIEFFSLEFIQHYHLEKGNTSIEYQVFKSLNYDDVLELGKEDYYRKITEMMQFARDGKYQLGDYPSIYYMVGRFDNFLKFNLSEFGEELKKSMTLIAQDSQRMQQERSAIFIFEHNQWEDPNQEGLRKLGISLIKNSFRRNSR